jgi:hypothetical protein
MVEPGGLTKASGAPIVSREVRLVRRVAGLAPRATPIGIERVDVGGGVEQRSSRTHKVKVQIDAGVVGP